nr:hypothetical protein [Armatimonas sp.]
MSWHDLAAGTTPLHVPGHHGVVDSLGVGEVGVMGGRTRLALGWLAIKA